MILDILLKERSVDVLVRSCAGAEECGTGFCGQIKAKVDALKTALKTAKVDALKTALKTARVAQANKLNKNLLKFEIAIKDGADKALAASAAQAFVKRLEMEHKLEVEALEAKVKRLEMELNTLKRDWKANVALKHIVQRKERLEVKALESKVNELQLAAVDTAFAAAALKAKVKRLEVERKLEVEALETKVNELQLELERKKEAAARLNSKRKRAAAKAALASSTAFRYKRVKVKVEKAKAEAEEKLGEQAVQIRDAKEDLEDAQETLGYVIMSENKKMTVIDKLKAELARRGASKHEIDTLLV